MKTTLTVFGLAALFVLPSAHGQQPTHQPPHSQNPPPPPMHGMEHGGMGGMMDPAKMTEHLKEKQAHLLMMHELSNKILAETDPQKQQALKDQQLEVMKAHHQKMMSMHPKPPMPPQGQSPMDHSQMH
jgi:hypothetical protein